MDGHALLGDIAIYSSVVGDGGPRGYRRRGRELPEKYLPGRWLVKQAPEARAAVVRAVSSSMLPAPWFLRCVVDEEPRFVLPPPPVDRRWSCRGRWSTPARTRAKVAQ